MVQGKNRGKYYILAALFILLLISSIISVFIITSNSQESSEVKAESSAINIADDNKLVKNSDLNSNEIIVLGNKPAFSGSSGGGGSGGGGSSGGGGGSSSHAECGNGNLEEDEECDDGNNNNNDCCNNACKDMCEDNNYCAAGGCGCNNGNDSWCKGEINAACIAGGFDFAVVKWNWNSGWSPEGGNDKGTSVTGTASSANWNVGSSSADGIVTKAANNCRALNGTNGTQNKIQNCGLSFILFCGYEAEEECGDGEVNQDWEECDLGQANGVPCEPPYNGNCTYCSSNCTTITLTNGFCGDNIWQQQYEECEFDENCEDNFCNITYQDACQGKKLVDYNNNNVLDSYNIYDNCKNNCDSECSCSDCEVDCSAQPITHCVIGECGAQCVIDDDCDDQDPLTLDECNLDCCTCTHTPKEPECGDGTLDAGEECDDGNTNNGDGCDEDCNWEIECEDELDCGEDNWLNEMYCVCSSEVWDFWINYTCVNPGQTNSYCTNSTEIKLREECGRNYCENWNYYCKDDNVWKERTCYDRGCLNGTCFNNSFMNDTFVKDCGEDEDGEWNYYCIGKEIWRNRTNYLRGCSDFACYENEDYDNEKYDECLYDCIDGNCTDCLHDVAVRYSYGNSFGTGIAIGFTNETWLDDPVELIKGEEYIIKYYIDNKIENTTNNIHVVVKINGEVLADYNKIIEHWHWKEVDLDISNLSGSYNISVFVEKINETDCNMSDNYANRQILIKECCDDVDCPDDEYSDNYCLENDVYVNLTNWFCRDGECLFDITPELVQDCGNDYCESWSDNYCKEDDVYRNRTCYDKGCSAGECFTSNRTEEEIVENCYGECNNGKCVDITCHNDSECPADYWLENEFCWCGKLFDYYIDYSCENDGTPESYCKSSTQLLIKGNCNKLLEIVTLSSCG